MKIYTKTGDKGKSSLYGGQRVSKSSQRIVAYGSVDELNSVLGVAINSVKSKKILESLKRIQNELFNLGSDLATPHSTNSKLKPMRLKESLQTKLESEIDFFDAKLTDLRNFILPGGSEGASFLHLGRTVCRRCERECVLLSEVEEVNPWTISYLNRLSDWLFVAARYENLQTGGNEIIWTAELD